MSNRHSGTVFRVLYKKISTGQEKIALIDRHDWHVFATLYLPDNDERMFHAVGNSVSLFSAAIRLCGPIATWPSCTACSDSEQLKTEAGGQYGKQQEYSPA